VIQPEPTNARFVGGPLDGETHLLAHRLPFVQMPGPDEAFFARLHIERPDAPDHLLYELDGAEGGDTLIYRCRADAPAAADAGETPARDADATPGPDGDGA
jgi:hypothetical protein